MPSRRRYLAGVASAGTVAIVGCTGESDYDDAADAAGDATDWPTLAHDGANTGYNPKGRGPESGVRERWTADISSAAAPPVVADDRVYVASGDDLLCLAAADGSEVWSHTFDDGKTMALWSAPTVRDGRVYVSGGNAETLRILDAATGEKRREFPTRGEVSGAPRLGRDGRRAFVSTTEGWIHCFDLEAGTEYWRTELFGHVVAPLAVPKNSSLLYVATEGGEVYALSKDDGGGAWRQKVPGMLEVAPAVVGRSVYVLPFGGRVHKLSTEDAGAVEWTSESRAFSDHHLAVADGRVFATDGDSLLAIDADSGETDWTVSTPDNANCAPAVADDTVYVGDESGRVHAVKTGGGNSVGGVRWGARRWKTDLGGRVREGVTVADGRLYAYTAPSEKQNRLHALEEP
ncbi:PQQ-binding-like beta-propeller repeat protein [Halorussus limi]|uniref:PQQ-binding-like beta-propeller repeat protein n=1 Tax=Halorussus limi TaxID=2938695 RepID=A0A8U0HX63_9EURY|nr:PQQ-binding-like beta-propeller repeat protein [Halorussus limi]UPV75164.1 PQQ-binding-like beta-propeller repeat protein [Halorussus limi]